MKLSKHIKFRKEKDYLLLCRVDTLQYFQLEKKFLNILEKLEESTSLESLYKLTRNEEELNNLLFDLRNIGVLETDERDAS